MFVVINESQRWMSWYEMVFRNEVFDQQGDARRGGLMAVRYSAADPQVVGSNPGRGGCISLCSD